MIFQSTEIDGVTVITPKVFGDARGYFSEVWRRDLFEQNCGSIEFVQDNESLSSRGVIRGLHFQAGASSQAKLVRVSEGTVIDVAVDLRRQSATFGRHIAVELSADNHRQLFVPRGFAHGFAVLSPTARFQYKVDNTYDPSAEVTLRFDDPALGIDWPVFEHPLLSPKDMCGLTLDEIVRQGLTF